ncbi:MAG: hypothetical protein LBF80_04990 [Spirochaetaceae bacterium]|nr:hypothetical protein [Spirochaetaceae bacterium]
MGKVALEVIPADKIVKDIGNAIIDLGGCVGIINADEFLDFASATNSCISLIAGTADLATNIDLGTVNQKAPWLAQANGVINGAGVM